MPALLFPPVEHADEDGFLGIGGPVSVENLLSAYRQGIFPWPWSEEHTAWFSPPQRAILTFSSFHIAESLRKILRRNLFEVRIDTAFRDVIEGCAAADNRKRQRGTWITREIIEGYCALHDAGIAHSFEAFQNGELVGGLYGVNLGGYFSGESMFYTVSNASKVALTAAVHFLEAQGVRWMDSQVMNENSASFGASEVPRRQFLRMLREAMKLPEPRWPRSAGRVAT